MHIRLVAVGDRQPAWIDSAFGEYVGRLPRQWQFEFELIASAPRSRGASADNAKQTEADKILARIRPAEFLVVLDERGSQLSSRELSAKLDDWQTVGQDIVFVIGGPDGVAPGVLKRANFSWSLSSLTLPHGLARVLFAEPVYRAWSLLAGHPYHRD